jgi:hypothetical protein
VLLLVLKKGLFCTGVHHALLAPSPYKRGRRQVFRGKQRRREERRGEEETAEYWRRQQRADADTASRGGHTILGEFHKVVRQ